MLVDKCILLELKAGRALNPAHEAQLLNYLRATEIEVGMLFSFGLKPEFKRLAFDNSRKQGGGRPKSAGDSAFDGRNKPRGVQLIT
jgi:hypothetical protein